MKMKDSGERDYYHGGAQRDKAAGKGAYELITPIGILRIAKVYEDGAKGKGARNWEDGIPLGRFMQSSLRHIFQYIEGYRDEDHLAQAAWNLLGAIHTEEMVRRGVLPASLDNLPNYLGETNDDHTKQ